MSKVVVKSINKVFSMAFLQRQISAAYPLNGFFVIDLAATENNPITRVYFNQDGKEVFSVEEWPDAK